MKWQRALASRLALFVALGVISGRASRLGVRLPRAGALQQVSRESPAALSSGDHSAGGHNADRGGQSLAGHAYIDHGRHDDRIGPVNHGSHEEVGDARSMTVEPDFGDFGSYAQGDPGAHGDHNRKDVHSHAASSQPEHDDHGIHAEGGDPHDVAGKDSKHGGHSEHAGHSDHASPGRGANSVAVGLVATTVMIPLVISMALSDGHIGELTMKMLDTFVSIFLAVLWFSAFDQFLVTFHVSTWFPMAAEVVCLMQVVVLYTVAMGVAWLWRDMKMHLTTFTVCGAHYIAFAGIGASAGAQATMSDMVDVYWSPAMSFLFVCMALGFISTMYLLNWLLFRSGKEDEKEFQRSIDEMEVDIAGLVISFLITQAVRQVITGHYPVLHHFFLQITRRQGSPDYSSTDLQRYLMLGWSVMLTIFAALSLPWIDEMAIRRGGHWAKLGTRFIKVIIIMLVAWGCLLWGTWEFYDNFDGDPMFGHMLFACLCTFVALTTLYVLAKLQGSRRLSPTARETNSITVCGLSLVAAWSWEHCFTLAFDVIGQRYQVGYGGLVPKLVMAVVIPCILVPTYVKHVRTAVLKAEEHEEHEREEYESSILRMETIRLDNLRSSSQSLGSPTRDSGSTDAMVESREAPCLARCWAYVNSCGRTSRHTR